MGRMSTQQTVAYLEQVGEFVAREWPRARKEFLRLSPPRFGRAAGELDELDTVQEAGKGTPVPISGEIRRTLRRAITVAAGTVNTVRGYLQRTEQTGRLRELPRLAGRSYDALIRYLKQVKEIPAKFRSVRGLETGRLAQMVRRLTALRPKPGIARKATKATTAALVRRQKKEAGRAALWVNFILSVAELAGRPQVAAGAPRQQKARRRRGRARRPAAKPVGTV